MKEVKEKTIVSKLRKMQQNIMKFSIG